MGPDYQIGTFQPLPATSWMAVAAFTCSVVGWGLVGIPLGIYARREIDNAGGRLTGRGFATAAIVIGAIELVLAVAVVIVILSAVPQVNSGP